MNKYSQLILRLLLGLIVLLFGIDKFIQFIPFDIPEGKALNMWLSLEQTAYFFPMLGGFEIIIGFLILSGLWLRLAVLALLPISINVALFHAFLFPEKIGVAVAVLTLNLYFIVLNYKNYTTLIYNKNLNT